MKTVIQNNNTKMLSSHSTPVAARSCSCGQKSEYPLKNECLSESLVCKEAFSQTLPQISKHYYGT